ncbi:DUF998 domain-containing protein [Enterococcus sp. CSURQ0835]|uniref:DUF998 domain-containing protein n=1 Tax=Enterococcus sp. CSURQ0835 TaxID=2681394 RepID=UPI001359420F|nr:DUF998 domain-containing protein [Enterococcus sp. CSURQ0835]
MFLLRKYGFYFLLFGVLSDFLTPYVLGFFFPKLNQLKMVISLFGEVGSPVRQSFLLWSVVSGTFFVLAVPALYQQFTATSRPLAILLSAAVGLYGLGDCIFTGLFSVETGEATWNFSTWVHNIGSGLGYAGFLLFPLFLILLYQKQGALSQVQLYSFLFGLSILVAGIYGLARIPALSHRPLFNLLGFWQRLSFFFNYLPLAVLALQKIKSGT